MHVVTSIAIVVGAASAAHADNIELRANLGASTQVLGDATTNGPALSAAIAVPLRERLLAEAVVHIVGGERRSFEVGYLHAFVGAGLRARIAGGLNAAGAVGVDKVWRVGGLGTNAHARIVPALRFALGYDVLTRDDWSTGVQLDAVVGLGRDAMTAFPDERFAFGLSWSIAWR